MSPEELLATLRDDRALVDQLIAMTIERIRELPNARNAGDLRLTLRMQVDLQLIDAPIIVGNANDDAALARLQRLGRESVRWLACDPDDDTLPSGIMGLLGNQPMVAIGIDGGRTRLRVSLILPTEAT